MLTPVSGVDVNFRIRKKNAFLGCTIILERYNIVPLQSDVDNLSGRRQKGFGTLSGRSSMIPRISRNHQAKWGVYRYSHFLGVCAFKLFLENK